MYACMCMCMGKTRDAMPTSAVLQQLQGHMYILLSGGRCKYAWCMSYTYQLYKCELTSGCSISEPRYQKCELTSQRPKCELTSVNSHLKGPISARAHSKNVVRLQLGVTQDAHVSNVIDRNSCTCVLSDAWASVALMFVVGFITPSSVVCVCNCLNVC